MNLISPPRLLPALLALGLIVAAFAPPRSVGAQEVMRIAAVVNDEVISVYDVTARIRLTVASAQLPKTRETVERLTPVVLRNLIDEKLRLQEAASLNVEVREEEIARAFADIEQRNNVPSGKLAEMMAAQGVDPASLRQQIRATIAWYKVVRMKAGEKLDISDAQVEQRLKDLEASADLPERRIWEIFLPVEDPGAARETRRLAERLVAQIRDGADFRALARQFSASASAQVGGDMGWVRKGLLPEEVEAAVSAMAPGEISSPVRSLSGYHVVRLVDRRAGMGFGVGDETVTLSQILAPAATQAELAATAEAAARAASQASSCEELEQIGQDMGWPLSGSVGAVQLSNMPADLQAVIKPLQPGQTTRAIQIPDGIAVFMVCARSGGEEPSIHAKRAMVREMMVNEKLDLLSRRFLRDVRRAAFIDVRM